MRGPDPAAETCRCFYAIEIDASVQAALAASQDQLLHTGADLSCPHRRDTHLTLLFLGSVETGQIPVLSGLLDRVSSALPAFPLRLEGVGTFGPPHAPRVVWAGVRASRVLERLHEALTEGVRAAGLAIDERPFAPHVTLARIGSIRGLAALTSHVASIRNAVFGSVLVRRTVLMRSHLDRPGARYSVLHSSPLKGP
jgi:2'-5' RNA ligase